jgi:hypothetical protein
MVGKKCLQGKPTMSIKISTMTVSTPKRQLSEPDREPDSSPISLNKRACFNIPIDVQEKAKAGVAEVLRQLDLKRGRPEQLLTGDKTLSVNSLQTYEKHYRGII